MLLRREGPIPTGQDPRRAPLKDGKLGHLRCDGWNDLNRGCAGANHPHPFPLKRQLRVPACGVDRFPLKVFHAFQLWIAHTAQTTGGGYQEPGRDQPSIIRLNLPPPFRLLKGRPRDFGAKANLIPDPVLISAVLDITFNLRMT